MGNYQSSEGFTKTYTTKDAVILSGQSLSAAIDLEQLNIATIIFPASWTTADITFQTSADGVTYSDVINDSGVEVKRTPVAGKAMGVSIPELSGVRFLKIRSGISGSPVNQGADRTLTLTLTNNAEGGGSSTGGSVSQSAATVPTATTMQSAATANGNGTNLNVQGYATAILNIASSPSMSGGTIINFEASTDDSEWQPILAHQIGVQGNQVLTTSTDGDYRINCSGFKSIRARISGYSAGAVTVKGYATPLSGPATTVGISGASDTAQTDATQTTSIGSFIKGMVKIFADVWNSSLHMLQVLASPASLEVSYTTTTVQRIIISSDATKYRSISVHNIVNGTNSTVNFEVSNDGTNWTNLPLMLTNSNSSGTATSVNAANRLAVGNLNAKYVSMNVTGISAGTTSGVVVLSAAPYSPHSMSVLAVQSGNFSLIGQSSGGPNTVRGVTLASNNAINMIVGAKQLMSYDIYNKSATPFYVKLYDMATTPDPATDTVKYVIGVPAGGRASLSSDIGLCKFSTGISRAIVSGIADNDNTAVGAGDGIYNIDYA